jgi:hypothetical protein
MVLVDAETVAKEKIFIHAYGQRRLEEEVHALTDEHLLCLQTLVLLEGARRECSPRQSYSQPLEQKSSIVAWFKTLVRTIILYLFK